SNIRTKRGGSEMEVTTIGIDLAKNVFAVSAADSSGRVVMRRQLRRAQVLGFMRGLPRCVVGMEATGGAHYWARQLSALGHEVWSYPVSVDSFGLGCLMVLTASDFSH